MSWRDTLQPASFRGVAFEVEGVVEQGGQRLAVHKYPATKKVEIEQLGEDERQFNLDAFVIGPDYAVGRDALIKALEESTPAVLVHPYGGQRRVSVQNWQMEETKREGGCASFRITFLRDDPVDKPSVAVDTQAASQAAAGDARNAAAEQFSAAFSVKSTIEKVAGLNVLTNVLQPVAQAVRSINGAFDAVQMQLLSSLVDPIASANSVLGNLIGVPSDLGLRVQSMIGSLSNASDLSRLFNTSPSVPALTGKQTTNRNAVTALVQTTLAIRSAELTAETDYASANEALAAQDQALQLIDQAALTAGPEAYDALSKLTVAVTTDIRVRSANLARITSYTPRETLPALVIAHRLYGPLNLEATASDIVARNKIMHPGFVSGGRELEVLTS